MRDIIVKAEEGGFDLVKFAFLNCKTPLMSRDELVEQLGIITFFDNIIFSHPFLKAFFGEDKICINIFRPSDKTTPAEAWKYHAQQLVIAEDRIEYLRRYLTKG